MLSRLFRALPLGVVLLAVPLYASAAVIITDVGYDAPGADEGREWVAIENTGPDSVDLTGWKFVEGGVNHKLVPLGSAALLSGARAVIVQSVEAFIGDHPGDTRPLFKASFSLNNTGETVSLKDASSTTVTSYTYAAPPPAPKVRALEAAKPSRNQTPTTPVQVIAATSAAAAVVAVGAEGVTLSWPWIAAGIVLLVSAVAAVYIVSTSRSRDGYLITEITNEE